MASHDHAGDREFCRAMLPRVSRTFAINIRLLRGSLGEAVRVAYLLCRAADTLEDAWPGTAAEIGGRFDRFEAALDGDDGAAADLARGAAAHAGTRPGREAGGAPAEFVLLEHLPRVLAVQAALPAGDRAPILDCARAMATGMKRYATRAAGRPQGGS